MSIGAVLFIIVLIVALIGTDNIIKVIAIGIPVVILGYILLKTWTDQSEKQRVDAEKKIETKYHNTTKPFNEGYEQRPTITGDHFSSYYDALNPTLFYYCRYANTANCANCSRRKEYKKDDGYYYGVSEKCKEYNSSYGDD